MSIFKKTHYLGLILACSMVPVSGMEYIKPLLGSVSNIDFKDVFQRNHRFIGTFLVMSAAWHFCGYPIWSCFRQKQIQREQVKNKQIINEQIIKDAYDNMPQELKECTTLQDIQKLLSERTDKAFEKLKDAFDISSINWRSLKIDIEIMIDKMELYSNHWSCNDARCDDCFEKEDIQKVHEFLKLNSITPNIVHIRNEDTFKEQGTGACTWSNVDSSRRIPEINICFSHKKQEIKNFRSICHEISHIIHHDSIIGSLLRKTINKDYEIIKTNELYKKWNSAYELRADIFLLLDPKNHEILQKYYEKLLGYVSGLKNITWNGIHKDGIHPNSEQTLMWLIKAQEIIEKSKK